MECTLHQCRWLQCRWLQCRECLNMVISNILLLECLTNTILLWRCLISLILLLGCIERNQAWAIQRNQECIQLNMDIFLQRQTIVLYAWICNSISTLSFENQIFKQQFVTKTPSDQCRFVGVYEYVSLYCAHCVLSSCESWVHEQLYSLVSPTDK